MSSRFGTFLYVPKESREVKSFELTHRSVVGLACVAIGICSLLLGLGAWRLAPVVGGAEPGLASENARLRAQVGRMEGQMASLGKSISGLMGREEELRIVADLPPVPREVQAVGVGGPGHPALETPDVSRDAGLNSRVATVNASVDALVRRSALLSESMSEVRKALAAKKERFSTTPSIWPASGFLSSTFSLHRRHPIFHDIRPHYGIDISARRGAPIVATAAGKVIYAGWENGHGNYVEIDHGHGVVTTYSHASRVLVHVGQKVERGDQVALIGSTGFSVAPHVHYEVHEHGKPVDPLKYIFPDAIAD